MPSRPVITVAAALLAMNSLAGSRNAEGAPIVPHAIQGAILLQIHGCHPYWEKGWSNALHEYLVHRHGRNCRPEPYSGRRYEGHHWGRGRDYDDGDWRGRGRTTVGVHLWAGVPIRGLLMAGNSAGAFRSVRSGIAPNAGSSLELEEPATDVLKSSRIGRLPPHPPGGCRPLKASRVTSAATIRGGPGFNSRITCVRHLSSCVGHAAESRPIPTNRCRQA